MEIQGDNGTAVVRPFSPARLFLDLKTDAGPYRSGAQEVPVAAEPKPAFSPDFNDLHAAITRDVPLRYTAAHDIVVQTTLPKACGYSI